VAKSAGAAGDRVAAAADELYGADPGEFTDRRKALADAARTAGDTAAAKRIAALRKPTRAAWVVNQLARADPDAPGRLAGLAAALRAAEQARDGRTLRELSASRGPLIDALTAQALAAAGVPDPPSGLREEVTATLTAAFADPEVAAEFAAGTLTRAAQWAGFGSASFADAPFGAAPGGTAAGATAEATEPGEAASDGAAAFSPGESATDETRKPATGRRLRVVPSPESGAAARPPTRGTAPARARPGSRAAQGRLSDAEQARRAQAEQERLAEEAAKREAQRRQAFDDAERTVASTAAAAAEAGAAEDQLEAEVRDLEQRLTQARADLAAARMRARHAEAAERRARQALDRLPRL
jgi:hypothetical protein